MFQIVTSLKQTELQLKTKNMAFYNTTNETGQKLEQRQQKAERQEDKVLSIFRESKRGLTASEVYQLFLDRRTPIGSIRRAITNLKNEKKLVKTDILRPGMYEVNEHEYQLNTGQMVLFN